jgi:hypothetical protein
MLAFFTLNTFPKSTSTNSPQCASLPPAATIPNTCSLKQKPPFFKQKGFPLI